MTIHDQQPATSAQPNTFGLFLQSLLATRHSPFAILDERKHRVAAFTLIEMIIVVAIISVLLGMLYGALERAQKFSRRTTAYSELKTIETAFKQYKAHYHAWPSSLPSGVTPIPSADNSIDYGFAIDAKIADLLQGIHANRDTGIIIPSADIEAFNSEMIPFLELSRKSPISHAPVNPFKPTDPKAPAPRAYKVFFDMNGDRQIAIPTDGHAPGFRGTNIIADVAVWTVIPGSRQVDNNGNPQPAEEMVFGSWDSFSVK